MRQEEQETYCQNKKTITIGNFDGQHVGHRLLFAHTKKIAAQKGHDFAVLSFNPHPAFLVCPNTSLKLIDSYDERRDSIITKSGADIFLEIPFTLEFSKTSPEVFLMSLANEYNCSELVIGKDYRFGKDRTGEITQYEDLCKKIGIELHIVRHAMDGAEKVASSNIRQHILERNFKRAEVLLGRKYLVSGKVAKGMKNGQRIGFPTANILPGAEKLLPPDGVYLTLSTIKGRRYSSITNIGKNPSFGVNTRTVESYIFDFSEEIYNELLSIEFLEFIRDEIKFENISALKEQIMMDVKTAKDVIACLKK